MTGWDATVRLNDASRHYWRAKSELHSAMRRAREAGLSYKQIADLAGVSASTVKRMVG